MLLVRLANQFRSYDLVFLGFFISHVPPSKMKDFLRLCYSALKPGSQHSFLAAYCSHELLQVVSS